MPRYELVEGTSSKFWQIEKAKGDTYKVSWGRIGSAGQTQLKKLTAAQHDKLVGEKVKKGYALVGGKPAKAAKAVPAKAAKPAASNPKLEETLYEAIDDKERWLVYADWLQQQGDVRGEIITLSLGKKKAAAKKLADANVDALWGAAAYLRDPEYWETVMFTGNWRGAKPEPVAVSVDCTLGDEGMIHTVAIYGLEEEGHVAKAARDLFSAPIGRFVRRLVIECANSDRYTGASGQPNADAVVAAIAKTKPASLRSIAIGSSGYQLSWTDSGRLGPLLKETPYLEDIDLDIGRTDLGKDLDLPKLQKLRIETGGLDRKVLAAIGKAKWPSLTELTLFLGDPDYGGNAKRADVAAVIANPSHFPKLKSLALCDSEIQGEVVRVVVTSPIVKQLERLDLSKGTLTDEDAALLVQNVATLKKLKELDLSENYLSPAFEKSLKKSFGKMLDTSGSRYDEMMDERAENEGEEWAKKHTFRYPVVAE